MKGAKRVGYFVQTRPDSGWLPGGLVGTTRSFMFCVRGPSPPCGAALVRSFARITLAVRMVDLLVGC